MPPSLPLLSPLFSLEHASLTLSPLKELVPLLALNLRFVTSQTARVALKTSDGAVAQLSPRGP